MQQSKLRPRYEMKKVPEQAIKDLRDYAESEGIDRAQAFADAVLALKREVQRTEMGKYPRMQAPGTYPFNPNPAPAESELKALEKKEG